jgi:membrane fusion protein (multidrug efflux system)
VSQEKQDDGKRRRPFTLVVVAVLLVAGSAWGIHRWRFSLGHVSTDNAQVDGHIVPVLAKVGGYLKQVAVEENQRVRRGELIAEVDPAELQVRLAEAEADVAAARASAGGDGVLGQVEAEASATRARRQALEERLNAARAERDRTGRDLVRMQELAAKQIVSSQQLDAAQTAADAAAAALAALQQDLAAARAGESGAGAAERAATARLARAEAALEQAKLNLEYARIQAPISGFVSKAQVEVGQLIQPGQPLGAVVSDSAVWVTANLKETELAEVREGQEVRLDVDAYPGCDAQGTVESLSAATGAKFALLPPDNATGNFTKVVQRVPVRIAVVRGCGEGKPLRPGMSVTVHISVR